MKADILLAIAKATRELPAESFDMSWWKRKSECGTTFCAIGTAIEHGLIPGVTFTYAQPEFDGDEDHAVAEYFLPVNGNRYGSGVLAEALDLSIADIDWLFHGPSYLVLTNLLTREMVAKRIEEFVQNGVRK